MYSGIGKVPSFVCIGDSNSYFQTLLFGVSLQTILIMEQTINNSTQTYSARGNQMETETGSLNRKRKFPAEQFSLPLSKHKSLQSSYVESGSITNDNHNNLSPSLNEVQSSRQSSRDISQSGSTKDSDSFSGGNTITMSTSGQVRNDIWYSKVSSSDQPSTSSNNWASTSSTKSLYSLESRPMAKASSSSEETESSYNNGSERDLDHNNFGSPLSPYYDDDHDLDFMSHADENMEQCTEDEDEDGIYCGVIANNYLLSSGIWPPNQDNEEGAKKLTIDKEFEEYFSSLML